jgi:signal transduction histidine kinase/DNA-binding CsgD family transcriptional regulator
MEKIDRSDSSSSSTSQPNSTLPEFMYSLSSLAELYEMGAIMGNDVEAQELYQHILTHMRRTIQATGACLLLYHNAQQHFIPIAHQGEKLPCGLIANLIHESEVAQLDIQGPGATLDTIHINQENILLVTLNCQNTLVGLVALADMDKTPLLEARSLLLSYMGNVAGGILYHHRQKSSDHNRIIEQERNRIARDLHDSVVQQIAFILYQLEFVQRLLEQNQLQQAILETQRAATILEESQQELRNSVNALRPTSLDQHTLADALTNLLYHYQINNPHMNIKQTLPALAHLPEQLEVPIFRLLQEALANIYKHAHATEVKINISIRNGFVIVEITDNGIGVPIQYRSVENEKMLLDTVIPHIGLRSMRERVQEEGGDWQLDSRPGIGTTIKASFPLDGPTIELTNREREILRLIVDGLSNRTIAQKLTISNDTVKTHIHHIMQKLQVKDRTQAVAIATSRGWI